MLSKHNANLKNMGEAEIRQQRFYPSMRTDSARQFKQYLTAQSMCESASLKTSKTKVKKQRKMKGFGQFLVLQKLSWALISD